MGSQNFPEKSLQNLTTTQAFRQRHQRGVSPAAVGSLDEVTVTGQLDGFPGPSVTHGISLVFSRDCWGL